MVNGMGMATFSTSSLMMGQHSITAVYGGSATLMGSTSASMMQSINAMMPPPPPSSPPTQTSTSGPASAPGITLHKPFLLALFDQLLGGVETINANGTETVTDNFFGIPLVSTYDGSGNLISVVWFGFNVTAMFML
jgi:hypothetical protein